MNTVGLLTPILDRGLSFTNYFNGRLLTAMDLKNDQAGNKARSRLIGEAIGEGIAFGLEVHISKDASNPEKPSYAVRVSSGVAVTRLGEVLNLPEETNVAIVPEKKKTAQLDGFFSACLPSETATILAGAGIYLLTISPVTDFDGYAPMSGLGGEIRGPKGCGGRDTVEGVQFRVIELSLEMLGKLGPALLSDLSDLIAKTKNMETPDPKFLSKLRNLVAHACFGTGEISGFAQDPFKTGHSSGVPDLLRSKLSTLEDCEVPLALIYLTSQGVQFVDMWSVRRRVTPRSAFATWPLLAGERRLAEAEAVFQQFQDQIQATNSQSDLSGVKAMEYFRYLPACGILPITSEFIQKYMADNKSQVSIPTMQQKGFAPSKFFESMTQRSPAFIEGAKLHSLLHESLYYPPVDLNPPKAQTGKEMIWLYFVRENIQSVAEKGQSQPYLVFVNGQIPYVGDARFDLNYWGYSNYA
jgi:hypothetical protein